MCIRDSKYTNTNEYRERFDNSRTIIVTSDPELCDQYKNVMKCLYVPPQTTPRRWKVNKSSLWEDVKSILQEYFDADSLFWETLPDNIADKLQLAKEGISLPSVDLAKYEHMLDMINQKLQSL